MTQKLEGTIVLDGLLQGRLPASGEVSAQLKEWVAFVGKLGPRFNLELRGNAFSLLPDDRAVDVRGLGAGPEHALAQAIEQLAALLPPPERAQLFSTLRSSEYRKSLEVQTIYGVTDGKVRTQSRSVETETTAPPEEIPTKQKIRLAAAGIGTAVLLLGIALLFPGVRNMFGQLIETVRPFQAAELKLDVGPYATWLTAELDAEKSRRGAAVVIFKRTAAYPKSDTEWDAAATQAAGVGLRRRLAFENLARGQVRIELFDDAGKIIGTATARTTELGRQESASATIPLPEKVVVTQITFVP